MGFWQRAEAFFLEAVFAVTAVMTDNCSYYRSHAFRDALKDADIKYRRTRLHRP